MSEQDRGAYTPQTDAPLAFDARRPRGGGGPAPMTLLVSAIILMALIVGLLLFYRHGVRHPGQAPEVIGAPVGQTKAAPPPDAGADDQAAGLQVYKSEAAPPREGQTPPAPTFETPPEQPAPLPAARPVAPPPAVMAPPPQPLRGPASPPPASPRPVVVVHPAPAKPSPAQVAAAGDTSNIAGSAFGPHTPAPPKPAAAGKPVVIAAQSATPPLSAAKPKPKPKAATAPLPEPADDLAAPSAGGGAMAQIGAFSSAALAQKGLSDDAQAAPGAMAGKSHKVEAASKDGKTFYRAYVGGFASKADAAAFCAALKAKAKPCFVK